MACEDCGCGEEEVSEPEEVQEQAGMPGIQMRAKLELVARDGEGNITSTYCNENDLITLQWVQFVYLNMLAQLATLTVTDVSSTGRSITGNPAATLTTVCILAGTGATAASVTDVAIQTQTAGTSGSIAATVNAPSESSGTSGSFTITGTITNSSGSTVNYSELGISAVNNAHTFLLTHDVFSAVPVSNTGTLAITYTLTNS